MGYNIMLEIYFNIVLLEMWKECCRGQKINSNVLNWVHIYSAFIENCGICNNYALRITNYALYSG